MLKSYHRLLTLGRESLSEDYDGILLPILKLPRGSAKKESIFPGLSYLPLSMRDEASAYITRHKINLEEKELISFDCQGIRLVFWIYSPKAVAFSLLSAARKAILEFKTLGRSHISVDLTQSSILAARQLTHLLVSAWEAEQWQMPTYRTNQIPQKELRLDLICKDTETLKSLKTYAQSAAWVTEGTNLVRTLTAEPPNKLGMGQFKARSLKFARSLGLRSTWFGSQALTRMGAGAFLAVAQGGGRGRKNSDAGILCLHYAPQKGQSQGHIAFVGKGVTFDTGGLQLKSATGMHGMHTDMSGAAVVLALLQLAVKQKWPLEVTGYLAISDNLIGPNSYQPGSVVTSLSGTTIEIVHTDAEGRMLLADTLSLACEKELNLLVDFATLTGAAKNAIGTNYSAIFSNRGFLVQKAWKAGRVSGERVWPFPMDGDFGQVLASQIADIKQCRLASGPDHIEAAWFLKRFVSEKTPWLHVDLAACQRTGGLAHVGSDITGFGVRFATELIRSCFKNGKFLKTHLQEQSNDSKVNLTGG